VLIDWWLLNIYFIRLLIVKAIVLIMLSKEEKLRYGEALRQQVPTFSFRWKKNKKWKETNLEANESINHQRILNQIEQYWQTPAFSIRKIYCSKDYKHRSIILSERLEEGRLILKDNNHSKWLKIHRYWHIHVSNIIFSTVVPSLWSSTSQ